MTPRTNEMTIQRRILAGNLAVAVLLLAPAVYAVIRLGQVGERTRESLESGLDTIRKIDRLRTEFETAVQLSKLSGALGDDPDLQAKRDSTLGSARSTYEELRPRLKASEDAPDLTHLDALFQVPGTDQVDPGAAAQETQDAAVTTGASLLERGAQEPEVGASPTGGPAPSTGTRGAGLATVGGGVSPTTAGEPVPSAGTKSAGLLTIGHGASLPTPGEGGTGTGVPASPGPVGEAEAPDQIEAAERAKLGVAPGPATPAPADRSRGAWSDRTVHLLRNEISTADHYTRKKLLDQTAVIRGDAERAGKISLMALCVTVPLALLSTFFVVRGIHRSLGSLMSATSAVAAGKFGFELPVVGSDEISQLARAFNKMSANLAVLDRMKADFINVVAHELKTPLTVIKGYAGALRSTLHPRFQDKEVAGYLERIDHEADLLSRRVSELLTYGVIEAGQLTLEPRDVMTEGFLLLVAEAFRPIAAERRIDFVVDIDPAVPPVFKGDPDRLNQVLLNLLDNAFKYTPEGGRVWLEGRVREGMLEVSVRDTGPGIPAEQLQTIFEKYARVRSSSGGRGGTGLGLAVARGIVLAHGGTIDAQSELGKGSSFRIRLPLASASAPARGKEVA